MNGFDAYKLSTAIKRHFESSKYDFFKYNGSIRAKKETFDIKKDRYQYEKLSKIPDLKNFLVANYVEHGTNIWVGDLTKDDMYAKTYAAWVKRKQSLTYCFAQDIAKLDDNLDKIIKTSGEYPILLYDYFHKNISIDTLVIMDSFLGFLGYWKNRLDDTIYYPKNYNYIMKYKPFVDFDIEKMKTIMKERWL